MGNKSRNMAYRLIIIIEKLDRWFLTVFIEIKIESLPGKQLHDDGWLLYYTPIRSKIMGIIEMCMFIIYQYLHFTTLCMDT